MIEKFLNNCIDELNSVVDKEKSKQTQDQEQDQQFRQNDQIDPNEKPAKPDEESSPNGPAVNNGYYK